MPQCGQRLKARVCVSRGIRDIDIRCPFREPPGPISKLPNNPATLEAIPRRRYGRLDGREKMITVADPIGARQRRLALPEVTATYCLPSIW